MGNNKMANEIILYSTPQGDKKVEVYFQYVLYFIA